MGMKISHFGKHALVHNDIIDLLMGLLISNYGERTVKI